MGQKRGQHKVDLLETLAASGSSHFFMIDNFDCLLSSLLIEITLTEYYFTTGFLLVIKRLRLGYYLLYLKY
mgnify:FL=1